MISADALPLPGGLLAPWLCVYYAASSFPSAASATLHALCEVSTHSKGMSISAPSLSHLNTHSLSAMIKQHLFNQSVNPLRLRSLTTEKCYALYEHATSTPPLHTSSHLFRKHMLTMSVKALTKVSVNNLAFTTTTWPAHR